MLKLIKVRDYWLDISSNLNLIQLAASYEVMHVRLKAAGWKLRIQRDFMAWSRYVSRLDWPLGAVRGNTRYVYHPGEHPSVARA
jgi:hypothetical protein